MSCVDDDGYPSKARGDCPVVMDPRIMGVNDVGAVLAKSSRQIPDRSNREASAFVECNHGNGGRLQLACKLAGMENTENLRPMAGQKVGFGEICGDPLQTAWVKIRNHLNDAQRQA